MRECRLQIAWRFGDASKSPNSFNPVDFRSERTLSAGTASASSSLRSLRGLQLALFPLESPLSTTIN